MAVRAPVRQRQRSKTPARPPLRVVKGKGRKRRSPIPIVVAVVLTVFSVTALHATMSQDGIKAAKLEREVSEETERLTLLRARVAQLSNAARIADEAAKLGLVGDPDARFIKVPLDPSQRLGPAAAGQPSTDPIKSLDAGAR
jgi:cell division protein FtsL